MKKTKKRTEKRSSESSDMSKEDSAAAFSEENRDKKKKIMPSKSRGKTVPKRTNGLMKSKNKKVVCDEPKKKTSRRAHTRTRYSDMYDDVESKFSVLERADKVLSSSENDLPHFLKCMLPSNVSHGFWLHLPKKFCSLHLPDHDTSVTLEDEWGNEYKTSYLLERHGLSAGWRGFSISHRLIKGDVLIFHLTEPCRFKVRIVRVSGPDVVNAALGLMSLDPSRREAADCEDNNVVKKNDKRKKRKRTTNFVDPFVVESPTPSSLKQEASNRSSSDCLSLEGLEVTNEARDVDVRGPNSSLLPGHSREGVTCM